MKINPLPEQEFLKECFKYVARTGRFTWRHRPISHFKSARAWAIWNAKYAGTEAGSIPKPGRRRMVQLDSKLYLVHRLMFKIKTGRDPIGVIDHKDVNCENYSWNNLREATHSQNNYNQKMQSNNRTGFKGVHLHESGNYVAQLQINGKRKHLGSFPTAELAHVARELHAKRLHKGFYNSGLDTVNNKSSGKQERSGERRKLKRKRAAA